MSDDFIAGLHDDLVCALERNERRRLRGLPSRAPRPSSVFCAAAVACAAIAFVVAARAERDRSSARPRVVAVLAIGGLPVDAARDDGSLWVSDFTGALVQVDASTHRVIRRIAVPGAPEVVAAAAGSVWALRTGDRQCGGELSRYDAGSGRLVGRRRLPYPASGTSAGGLAADDHGLWVKSCTGAEGVERLGRPGTVTGRVALARIDEVTVAAGSVWAIGHDGTLVEIDAANGRVRHRWRRLAPLGDLNVFSAVGTLAPDRAGLWVLSTGRAAILRIERGRVVGEISVDATARPLLALAGEGLWIAATGRSGTGNRLIRYDRRSGRASAALDLGDRRPVALLASGDQLCVITGDGRVLFVRG